MTLARVKPLIECNLNSNAIASPTRHRSSNPQGFGAGLYRNSVLQPEFNKWAFNVASLDDISRHGGLFLRGHHFGEWDF